MVKKFSNGALVKFWLYAVPVVADVPNDEYALMLAVKSQPVAVDIVVDRVYEQNRDGKIYVGDHVLDKDSRRRHSVCIIRCGKDRRTNVEYWMIRESKGELWNGDGHVKIWKNNIFGKSVAKIAENAYIPLMRGLKPPKLADAFKKGLYSPAFYEYTKKSDQPGSVFKR
ncbi:putative fruit bromelain [Helianthus annuus]|nr:putative fruit bromelain [Helianthus annuus]